MMRRTALLLVTTALALVAAGGIALAATFTCTTNPCEGTTDADVITGTVNAETINGKAGNDEISARDANDTINGEDGSDTMHGEMGDDQLNGGDGPDQLFGENGTDRMNGGAGNDTLDGGPETQDDSSYYDYYNISPNWGNDTIIDGRGQGVIGADPATAAAMPNIIVNLVSDSARPEVTDGNGNTVNWESNDVMSATTGAGDDVISQRPKVSNGMNGGAGSDTYRGYTVEPTGGDTIYDPSGTAEVLDISSRNLADVQRWSAFRDYSPTASANIVYLQISFGGGFCIEEFCNYITIYRYFDNTSTNVCASGAGPGFIETIKFADDQSVDFAQVKSLLGCPTPDTTPPPPPVITSPANNTIDTDGILTLSGTAEANSTVELFEGPTSLGTTTTDASGNWSKTLPPVDDGSYTYTAKAKDAAGNTSDPSSPLTVEVRIPPVITNVSPAHQAASVLLNTSVAATFSEAMDSNTITKDTFILKEQGLTTTVAATVSYNPTTKKATLTPETNLAPDTTYTATLKGGSTGAKDLAGNALAQDRTWTFTTASAPPPPPPAPPAVESYTPIETTGVARGIRPTATFSEEMDASTITSTTIKFRVYNKKKKKWISVAHGVTYDAPSRTATVTHETALGSSKKYKVTVTTNVRSSAGLALDQNENTSGNQPKVWTFTTGTTL